jgi:hypothetical protein
MTNAVPVAGEPEFQDRKTGLMVFGIIEIILGALCALLLPCMVGGMVMANAMAQRTGQPAPMQLRAMVPGAMLYALLAVFFITMGVGSIRARRWARALMLVVSSMWLVMGAGALLGMVFVMPHAFDKGAANGNMPPAALAVVKVVMFLILTIIYLVVPGVFVLFYSRPHVKATCERLDPVVRWTDRCPLPVLALVLMFAYSACWMPTMGLYHWVIPFFGRILSGPAGAGVVLAAAVVSAWLAWGMYRLKPAAWWAALLLMLVWAASAALTFTRVSLFDMYAQMNFPKEQLDQMQTILPRQAELLTLGAACWVIFLGYLLYTRRFFAPAALEGKPTPGPGAQS